MHENTFYPNLVRHLCAARDFENARKHILPQFCSTSMCCERLREYPKTHFTQSCSTSMCCERFRECSITHSTPILFDIDVLRETQTIPENTFYPNLARQLCAARDLENTRKHILPQSCSTSMCCERLREYPKTHFTPILFDIYVLRETLRIPDNTFYPNFVRHLCAARDLENARKHILPQSCSTSMCFQRLREYPKTHFTQSCSTSMCCERLRECPKTHFTPILFDIYVLRET